MMADIKTKYPAASSVALSLTLAALAADTNLLAGRTSAAVDNTTNADLDHLVSGVITTGTSPSGGQIEVWAYAPYKTSSGTPTYPDSIAGTDVAKVMSSANVKAISMRLVAAIPVDTASNRGYPFAAVSIAGLFGSLPKFWGLFIVHSTGVALNATSGNHDIQYERIQAQSV